ncbi:adenylate/guanylate cyclase domain-containing protein [Singulisphaera sp. Ch08]|uniref:Adenylate/guanylate cyclase domain-containing protein n=1 Tax=Singulisphaera sp. Ch08 TaxID=3120278 RepID=A0AAU7CNM6_9BACT
MPELVARGNDPKNQWRRPLPDGLVILGRSVTRSDWSVPWDSLISKVHATLGWSEGRLTVRKWPQAKNAIFVQGEARDEFNVGIGDTFVIGETLFLVQETETAAAPDLPPPFSELTCSRGELEQHRYTDAHERLDVLAALPAIIRDSPSDADLEARVIEVLLKGIPRAEIAAVVRWSLHNASGEPVVEVRHFSRRSLLDADREFRPSRRLVGDAVLRRRQSVMHLWQSGDLRPEFTINPGFDWSLCVPLPDDPEPGWALYISGRLPAGPRDGEASQRDVMLKSDLKFAELVADVFGAFRHVRDLQHRQSRLARFLSRQVLAALSGHDMDEVLKPREAEVTVLFCDLRSSSRLAEESRHELPRLWERVNQALGIITSAICDQDGVIGDFQGDAAMGFWGWPLDADDQIERAARAALAIRRRFDHLAQQRDHPLAGFACGVGIANGPAIAGRLGTYDQFKVGVFGPVVNLASRLESMTKRFHASILVDERIAERLANPRHSNWVRCRRMAKVLPHGLTLPVVVSELLPPAVESGTLTDRHCRDYEAALDAFLAGRWNDARRLLERLPNDAAGDVLKQFMDRTSQGPPDPWDGVIPLDSK